MVASLGRSAKRTHAEKILVLLIESGALYCLICVSRSSVLSETDVDKYIGGVYFLRVHPASWKHIRHPVVMADNDSYICKSISSWMLIISPQSTIRVFIPPSYFSSSPSRRQYGIPSVTPIFGPHCLASNFALLLKPWKTRRTPQTICPQSNRSILLKVSAVTKDIDKRSHTTRFVCAL